MDPDAWLSGELTKRELDRALLTPSVVTLAALDLGPGQRDNWKTFLGYELAWRMTTSAGDGLARAPENV